VIEYQHYKYGKFIPAFKNKSSELNKQLIIGIEAQRGKILLKQIAGIIAHRIICYVKIGDMTNIGEQFGIIKYGSRVDFFIPLSSKINMHLNEKVKAGETIITKLQENERITQY
jgi:phosphatidylserine decarboxylase